MSTDKQIIELQKKIEVKRKELGDKPEFKPVTGGRITTSTGERANLHTAPKDISMVLLLDLNSRRISAEDLGMPYEIGEHSVDDWISDLQQRLVCLEYEQERKRLESLERQLDRLLSEEEKKARKVKEIAEKI